jgi:hypothetical protein
MAIVTIEEDNTDNSDYNSSVLLILLGCVLIEGIRKER